MRALVADDDPGNREILRRMLLRLGFEVDTASGGREALGSGDGYTWYFLDLGMPDLDGREVARRLRESGRPGRVAAVTGADREGLGPLPAFDLVLEKPLTFEILRQELAPFLGA